MHGVSYDSLSRASRWRLEIWPTDRTHASSQRPAPERAPPAWMDPIAADLGPQSPKGKIQNARAGVLRACVRASHTVPGEPQANGKEAQRSTPAGPPVLTDLKQAGGRLLRLPQAPNAPFDWSIDGVAAHAGPTRGCRGVGNAETHGDDTTASLSRRRRRAKKLSRKKLESRGRRLRC